MIYLSCGHQVSDFDQAYDIVTKHYDRMGERALMYSMVCGSCMLLYKTQNMFFLDDASAEKWLLNKDEE